MEDKSISFTLYKLSLIAIKYGPFIVGLANFISTILGCVGICTAFFAGLFQLSFISTLIWLLLSFTFKCCIWHRLPIYYCWMNNLISWIDFQWTIPVDNLQMILIYSGIALMFIIMGMYFKNRYNDKRRNGKGVSAEYSR